MKTAKRILSMLVVLAMMFSLSISTFAVEPTAEDTYTITISDDKDGHTYGAYQVFTGDLTGTDNYILSSIEWGNGVNSAELLTELKSIESFKDCENAQDVADVLATFSDKSDEAKAFAEVVAKHLSATKTPSTYNNSNYTITGLTAGYYFVKDDENLSADSNDSHTRYILGVVGNISVNPKKDVPKVVKKVLEDTDITDESDYTDLDKDYNDVADWDMGETKSFLISADLPDDIWEYKGYDLIFHDTFTKGITVTDAAGTDLPNTDANSVIDPANYEVYYYVDGKRFDLDSNVFTGKLTQADGDTKGTLTFSCTNILDDIQVNAQNKEVEVVIVYNAKLNKDAVVGLGGNVNDVYLEYSNFPYGEGTGRTEKDEVIVFTFELEGTKIDGSTAEGEDKVTLENAEFILGKDTNNDGTPDVWAEFDADGKFTGNWVATATDESTIKSDANGKFKIIGLDADTYYLKETKAPDGYNKLKEPVKIVVETTATAGEKDEIYTQEKGQTPIAELVATIGSTTTTHTTSNPTVIFEVENKQGSTLPSTGDTGRGMFYAIGAMGFSIIAIILITRKRMSKYKDNK